MKTVFWSYSLCSSQHVSVNVINSSKNKKGGAVYKYKYWNSRYKDRLIRRVGEIVMWLKRLECWLHIHIIGRIFVNIILINTGCDRWQNNRVIIITRYLRGKRYVSSRLRGCNNISGQTVYNLCQTPLSLLCLLE